VLEKNPETVKIAFKNLPLTSIHNMAEPAALAGLAAHKQGKFWQMHDEIFAMKTITMTNILNAAQKIGLDMEAFNRDMNSMETKQLLQKDLLDARSADVSGTPTLFLNGRRVSDRSPQGLQNLINQELAKIKK
jgi:protein-disulfide isomerase